jgi:hypothetical protein
MSAIGRDGLQLTLTPQASGAYALTIVRDGQERTERWSTLDKALARAERLGVTDWSNAS